MITLAGMFPAPKVIPPWKARANYISRYRGCPEFLLWILSDSIQFEGAPEALNPKVQFSQAFHIEATELIETYRVCIRLSNEFR
jgi:hypothetical protein